LAARKIRTLDRRLPRKHAHILAERFFLDGTAQTLGNSVAHQLKRQSRSRDTLVDRDDMKAVACLDQFAQQALGDAETDLVRVLGPIPELARSWRLLTHPDLRQTPRVAAFFDFMLNEREALRPILTG